MEPLVKYRMARNYLENCSDFEYQYLDYKLSKNQSSADSDSNRTPSGTLQF